ncbi:hypothetical protein AVEN_82200-1 [Araneus ventricosus]|uniref:BTB domain-containing protein n=1 Tax=Araneus ventricosus TaxID=182803 RepID=A0A4Y2JIP3_ARAVE|nr:hypothetical protein AVEN_82200-1 [Araneus ventricosus]
MACFTIIWELENYSELPHCSLSSPWFSGDLLENTRWQLWLKDEENINLPITCYIFRGSDDRKGKIDVSFEIAIIGVHGLPLLTKSGEKSFEECSKSEWVELIDKITILELKGDFLWNNILTLRCQLWVKNSTISRSELCLARTVLGVEKREFFWANTEFSKLKPGERRSLLVQPHQKGAPTAELTLFLKQTSDGDDVVLEVNIGDCKGIYGVFAKISVVGAYGQLLYTKSKEGSTHLNDNCLKFEPFIQKAILQTNESCTLLNDTLFLKCELKTGFGPILSRLENYGHGLASNIESTPSEETKNDLKKFKETSNSRTSFNSDAFRDLENVNDNSKSCCSFCPLKRALERLKKDGILPDVCLKSGSKSFCVHKDIVGSKSHSFKNLFEENVTMKSFDLDTQNLHHLLTYIYLDRDVALDMLEVAKKFNIVDLEQVCSEFLTSCSSTSSEQGRLALSEKNQGGKPKRRVRHHIFDAIISCFF